MKTTKFIPLILVLFALTFAAFKPATPILSFQSTPDNAEAILKNVKDKYATFKTMKAEYKLLIKPAEGGVTEAGGTFYIKGDKFRIETMGQIIMANEDKMWVYYEDMQELTINKVDDANFFRPSDIFALYDQDFQYSLIGSANIEGRDYHVIKFNPLKKHEVEFHTITLFINKKDNTIGEARIKDKNNTEAIYKITKFTPNPTLADNFFEFDRKQYPVSEEVDNTTN